jgi:flagellar protein FlbD
VFILLSRGPFDLEDAMITLTRLNGQRFVINADKIRYVEQTPDTVVCYDNGDRLMVKESMDEVLERAIEYARIIRKSVIEY